MIGLPPNLFFGTGIPACVLVLRARNGREAGKPLERRGKVLFINADAEFHPGRAQNYLRPEHVEKIVSTFDAFSDVPRYARVVTLAELAEQNFNCNIRRYADNAPPPEPQDVRAHLIGGVPKAEVDAKHDLFAAHGFDPSAIFVERDDRYYDFRSGLDERREIADAVTVDAGVQAREEALREAFGAWWEEHKPLLRVLPTLTNLMVLRTDLLRSFGEALVTVGLMDQYKVAGVVASWWNESQYDLKAIAAQGFDGLIDGWIATIRAALEEPDERQSGPRFDPLTHRLVVRLLQLTLKRSRQPRQG